MFIPNAVQNLNIILYVQYKVGVRQSGIRDLSINNLGDCVGENVVSIETSVQFYTSFCSKCMERWSGCAKVHQLASNATTYLPLVNTREENYIPVVLRAKKYMTIWTSTPSLVKEI